MIKKIINAEYLNLVYKGNPDKLEKALNYLILVKVKTLEDLSNENKDSTSKLINWSNQKKLLLKQNNYLINEFLTLKTRIANLEN